MTTLRLVGWKPGIKTVSLLLAIKDHSRLPLNQAKQSVDALISGEDITLEFESEEQKETFRRIAEELGAVVG